VTDWERLADWWLGEVEADPAYETDVVPLLRDTFAAPSGVVLDAGCGDGRIAGVLAERSVIGCDISAALLDHARHRAPVVRSRLPSLAWLQSRVLAGIVAVLVTEHVPDIASFFGEAARVTEVGGTMTVVMNHPAYTAPTSGPVVDQSDGEVLWRWGPYFDAQPTQVPAGSGTVTFHHRQMSTILNAAAAAGWSLEVMDERPLGTESIAGHPGLVGQEHFPRLLGLRWRNT